MEGYGSHRIQCNLKIHFFFNRRERRKGGTNCREQSRVATMWCCKKRRVRPSYFVCRLGLEGARSECALSPCCCVLCSPFSKRIIWFPSPPTFLLPLFNLPIHACREGVMTKWTIGTGREYRHCISSDGDVAIALPPHTFSSSPTTATFLHFLKKYFEAPELFKRVLLRIRWGLCLPKHSCGPWPMHTAQFRRFPLFKMLTFGRCSLTSISPIHKYDVSIS